MIEAFKSADFLKKYEPQIDQLRKNAEALSGWDAGVSQLNKIINEYDELMVSFAASDIYTGKLVDRANEILEDENHDEVTLRVILNEYTLELDKCKTKLDDFVDNQGNAYKEFMKNLAELMVG